MRELICFLCGVGAGYLTVSAGGGILVVGLVSFAVTFVLMEITA